MFSEVRLYGVLGCSYRAGPMPMMSLGCLEPLTGWPSPHRGALSIRWRPPRHLHLATAIHIVKLVSKVVVLAFTAIELVWLAVFGSNPDEIVAISTVENVHTWGKCHLIFSQLLST